MMADVVAPLPMVVLMRPVPWQWLEQRYRRGWLVSWQMNAIIRFPNADTQHCYQLGALNPSPPCQLHVCLINTEIAEQTTPPEQTNLEIAEQTNKPYQP